jgi:hypothetical protein
MTPNMRQNDSRSHTARPYEWQRFITHFHTLDHFEYYTVLDYMPFGKFRHRSIYNNKLK